MTEINRRGTLSPNSHLRRLCRLTAVASGPCLQRRFRDKNRRSGERQSKAGPFLCECRPLPGVALTRHEFLLAASLAFDIKKQFGFVKVAGLRDTFLHMAVLKEAGYTFVPAGTTLRFTAGKSAGKPRIDEIHSVDTSTAEEGQPDPVRRKRVQADEGGG